MAAPAHDPATAAARRAERLAGVGTWSFDLRTGAFSTNVAARTMLGWPEEAGEPTVHAFWAVLHPDDREELQARLAALADTGEDYDWQHSVRFPDGRVLHMRAVGCAARDERGRPVVLSGITQDVTALRRSSMALALARDSSAAVLRSMREGYLLHDGVRGVVLVNVALCRMTGFEERELLGTGPPPFWPQDRYGPLERYAGPAQLQDRDGRPVPVELTQVELPADPDGSRTPELAVLLRDTSAQEEREHRLRQRATTDPLTDLPNSGAFRDRLTAALAGGGVVSLAVLDLDHFKSINDGYGHAVGDDVLRRAAQVLGASLQPAGQLCRIGGEEFAVVLSGCPLDAARARVEAALGRLRSVPLDGVGTISASAGVAQHARGMSADDLFRLADGRLYEAKAAGRDRVV